MTQILYKQLRPGDETYWNGCDPETKVQYSQIRGRSNDELTVSCRGVHERRVSFSDNTAALTRPLTSSPPSPTPPSQQQPQPWRVAVTSVRYWWGPGEGGAASGASSVFICTGGLAGPANCRGTVVVPTATVVSYYNCCVIVLRA